MKPFIGVIRPKFEPTNQDLAGRKNFTVLTSASANRKGNETRQLFFFLVKLNPEF